MSDYFRGKIAFERILAEDKHAIQVIATMAADIWMERYAPIVGAAQVVYMVDMFQSASAITEQIKNGMEYRLLRVDDKPIGYMAFCQHPDCLYLSKLYLCKEWRKKGISRRMLDIVIEWAKKTDQKKIALNVNRRNTDSIDVYKRLGFVCAREECTDIGHNYVMDDYVYELAVAANQ